MCVCVERERESERRIYICREVGVGGWGVRKAETYREERARERQLPHRQFRSVQADLNYLKRSVALAQLQVASSDRLAASCTAPSPFEAWRGAKGRDNTRENNQFQVKVLLYVHRNRRLIRDESPGRPPRLSHSS